MSLLKTYLPHSRRAANIPAPGPGSDRLVLPHMMVGIEIESELWNVDAQAAMLSPHWDVMNDGSLRGDEAHECVSHPMNGEKVIDALDCYEEASSKFEEHFTWRCSTHVHLNMLEEQTATIAKLIPLTLMTDNFLYAAGDEWRRGNHNCRPLSILQGDIERLAGWAYQMEREPDDLLHIEDLRYMGTNWTALTKQSTLEFRHFPGANKTEQVLRWVNLTQGIVTAARKFRVEQLRDWFYHDLETFGFAVFGEEWPRLRYDEYKSDWREAVEAVKLFFREYAENGNDDSFDSHLRAAYVLNGTGEMR